MFTFVREGMMYVEFNSVTLFTVLYSRFLNCAKDVSKVTAQPTILECKTYSSVQLFIQGFHKVLWKAFNDLLLDNNTNCSEN